MYQILLGVQCISIVVLFLECWVVFKNWKGTLHSYLFFGCAATLINNLGYFFELRAKTEEAYFTALCFSYMGRVWISFALLFFMAELVRFVIPRGVKILMALINVITYVVVITTGYTGLFYKNLGFTFDGEFPVFIHKNGGWHIFWNFMLFFHIGFGMTLMVRKWMKEKNPIARKRLITVAFAVITQSVFLVIQLFHLIPAISNYDVTMLSFPIAAVFMFIAIYRYSLLDTAGLAREYVIDELSEGIIAVDEGGEVGFFNKTAVKLMPKLQENPQEVIGRLRHSMETKEPIHIADRIYSPTANELIQDGTSAGTLYALSDETEYFQYMEELTRQKQIADQANKAKSSFLANMSHEIRTPINAVLGMDEMILREAREKDILSYAMDIQTAGRTLLSLINDILDFSKIEEGRMEILPTQYELSSVINDLINMVRDRAEKKGLKLNVQVDREIPHLLYGDEIRIKQIALNLLTNAVKYTEKGEVTIAVSFEKNSDDEIGLSFRVADTGIGMKEEDMVRLFSPFSRIEEKRNRSIEGTGLGMSIVKQLLALMDSQLEVKSVYGEGSEFSFVIRQKVIKWEPMGDYAIRFNSQVQEREAYQELFHAPSARLLVVDDTEVNLVVIRNLLKRTQVKIDTVTSGKEALALAKEVHYDIVFLDHMMPEWDGIETLHKMKEETDQAGTVYVILTANAVSGAREGYLAEGFDDYMSKPVDGIRLEEMLRKYLPADKLIKVEQSVSTAKESVGASQNGTESQRNLQSQEESHAGSTDRLTKEMMVALSHTVDAKDHFTNGHSSRVAAYSAEIARRMGKSPEEQKKIYEIGLLHDVGKIGISEDIINKKERLTEEEFNKIKEHTVIGFDILKGITDLPMLAMGARSHHERYDGSGYPDGLKGEEIPEVARIICVADCYDAMTSTRTYSNPKPQELVRAEIVRCSGTHFDPQIAQIMISMIDDDTNYIMNERGGGAVWKGKELIWNEKEENDGPDGEGESRDDTKHIPDWLREISELDVNQGIINCGSEDSLMSVLEVFHQTAEIKADEIENYYSEGDLNNYTIKVHALKSSARIVGALELSNLARDLEMAGKAGDLEVLHRDTGTLLKMYRELNEKLSPMDIVTKELLELPREQWIEVLQMIREAAERMDFGEIEAIFHELRDYVLASEDEKAVKEMEGMLLQLDFEGISTLTESLILS